MMRSRHQKGEKTMTRYEHLLYEIDKGIGVIKIVQRN